jgi:hypothetical protein
VPKLLQGSAREPVCLYEALKDVRRNLLAIATTLDENTDLGPQRLSILENNGHSFPVSRGGYRVWGAAVVTTFPLKQWLPLIRSICPSTALKCCRQRSRAHEVIE